MSESFKKIKRLFLRGTAIKSAVCGVSAGLFVVGVVLLSLKLSAIAIHPAYYVLMGVAVAAVCGAGLYFIMRPTEKRLARHLDNEYKLNEKVQTMVAYKDSDDEMAALQRENTDEIVGSLKIKTSFKKIWQYILVSVLALAMFFTAVFVPAKKTVPFDPEIPFDPTEVQITALRQLIDDVKKSDMQTELVDSVVVVLEELLDNITKIDKDSVMRQAVISSVVMIDGIIAVANSYMPIAEQLVKTDRTKPLATSLNGSIISYRTDSVKIKSLQRVNEKADKSDDFISAELRKASDAILEVYVPENALPLSGTAFTEELTALYGELASALDKSGFAEKQDPLYIALNDFAAELDRTVQNSKPGSGHGEKRLTDQVRTACSGFVEKATVPLGDQTYNCMMDEFVRERLAEIFGIPSSDLPKNDNILPDDENGGASDGENGDENDGSHSGGIGEGDNIYGSKDIIYYPDDDAYVEYGTVINSYYAAVLEHINDGDMSEELKQYIRNYFDILLSGIKE